MSPSVAVTAPLPGDGVRALAERFTVRTGTGRGLLGEDELGAFVGDADAVISLLADPVGARVIEASPNLKVIANCAVGYDNIDLDAARRRGIWVTNTPDVLTEATADLTWALILAVTRRVVEGDAMVRGGRFAGWRMDLLLGSGLQGKTLGLVGMGRIGAAVAGRAPAFGLEVVYAARRPLPVAVAGARRVGLDELLKQSHIVSLHCPLTDATHHLLDAQRLALMRRGAFLINTARGPVVDEAALVGALEAGRLAGAGLDVYEEEPAVHPRLVGRTDVVLLPHVGSATVETRTAMADLAAANVAAVLDGREPPTPVVRPSSASPSLG